MPIVLLSYMLDKDYFTHPRKKRKTNIKSVQLFIKPKKSKPIKIKKSKSKVFTFSKHDIRLSQFNALDISQRPYE